MKPVNSVDAYHISMSKQKFYIVMGTSVTTLEHWAVAVYEDKTIAEEHASRAEQAINDFESQQTGLDENGPPPRNPWDPKSYMYRDELYQYYVIATKSYQDLKHFRLAQG